MSMPEDDPPPGVPEWVVTYGDMMSLLLTFFIMLVSMSALKDDGSNRAMLDAIREAFGFSESASGVPGDSLQQRSALGQLNSEGIRSEGGTKRASRNSNGGAGAHKSVRRISHGTVVTMGGAALFERFNAAMTEELKANLDVIAQVLRTKENRLFVRGHASAEPLPEECIYRDKLDLSFARAHIVAQYLIEHGIDPRRILVSAVGDSEPRLVTRDPEAQKLNRRVDVFLIDSYITRSASSDSGNGTR